ncbi:MAG: hypothetical protein HQL47_07670 [Gammaproteobacteria bacterium]|nr:hypothetical protein [Gammaproteobacteria bacterium]
MPAERGLLFVYKADSGLFNTASDIAHKLISPQTYACNLCALTHGYFSMRKDWAGFLQQLDLPCEFRHRDELTDEPGVDASQLPAIYRWWQGAWHCCASPEQIQACTDLEQLKALVTKDCLSSASG